MPTLGGFLKKKRTKDSNDTKEAADPALTSATSTLKNVTSNSSSQLSHPSSETESATHGQPLQRSVSSSAPQDASIGQEQPEPAAVPDQEVAASKDDPTDQANTMDTRPSASVQTPTPRVTKGKYTLTDFTIQRTLGTGSFGRVHLVQSKHNQRFYAVKVLKKQQVVKMKQVEHTNDERRMLQRVKHPFLITLWGTFQDSKNLYMVMDFVEGGELFSLLRKSQVRSMAMPWEYHPAIQSRTDSCSDSPIRLPNSMQRRSPWLWITYTHSTLYTAI